jgi:Skp family chaperone for outer membrane proteins
MSSQIRRVEIKQRRTRKKKVSKLRAKYKKATSEERQRIEEKLQRVARGTPVGILLQNVSIK